MKPRAVALLAVSVMVLAGCDLSALFDRDDQDTNASAVLDSGVKVELLAPEEVEVRDSFEVKFTVQNLTREDVVVTTGNSCLVRPGIFADGKRVLVDGSVVGCLAAITRHRFPEGKTEEQTFDMQAVLTTSEGEVPVLPGTYTIKIEVGWSLGRTLKGDHIGTVLERELAVHL